MFKGPKDLIPTIDTIIEETAKYYGQTPEDLKGKSRMRDTVLARHVAMYLIRKLTNFSLKDTGSCFEDMHYTTVLTSVRKIEGKIQTDQQFANIIKDITSNINSKKEAPKNVAFSINKHT